jgi:hypothetical protein
MKATILTLALALSSPIFARQYIQCSTLDTTDVMVINLPTPKKGTLFLSSGMQNSEDERIIVDIEFDKIQNDHHLFKVVRQNGQGSVAIPSSALGFSSDYVQVGLKFSSFYFDFHCFSRLYEN